MTTRWRLRLFGVTLLAMAPLAAAQVPAGRVNDAANATLVGSNLGAPRFGGPNGVADSVAPYAFSLPLPGQVPIERTGYAAGGADPTFSLFRVAGAGAGASFIDSNWVQAFASLSFTENTGGGGLAAGFVGLGQPGALGDTGQAAVSPPRVPTPSNPSGEHHA